VASRACLADSSTLKIEATCFSETSVDFQRTTRHYIPEDRTLHCNVWFGRNPVKFKLSLCSGTAPWIHIRILILSSGRRCVVIFKIWPRCYCGRGLQYLLDRKLGGSQGSHYIKSFVVGSLIFLMTPVSKFEKDSKVLAKTYRPIVDMGYTCCLRQLICSNTNYACINIVLTKYLREHLRN
jgi:hypothetical protein